MDTFGCFAWVCLLVNVTVSALWLNLQLHSCPRALIPNQPAHAQIPNLKAEKVNKDELTSDQRPQALWAQSGFISLSLVRNRPPPQPAFPPVSTSRFQKTPHLPLTMTTILHSSPPTRCEPEQEWETGICQDGFWLCFDKRRKMCCRVSRGLHPTHYASTFSSGISNTLFKDVMGVQTHIITIHLKHRCSTGESILHIN